MGKRGPPRVPRQILEDRGSWLAKTRDFEPEADGVPQKPDWLYPVASDVWDFTLPLLLDMKVAAEIDTILLGMFCTAVSMWADCMAFVAKNGMSYERITKTGELSRYLHPEAIQMIKLQDQILRYASHFGMTPSTRSNINKAAQDFAVKRKGEDFFND